MGVWVATTLVDLSGNYPNLFGIRSLLPVCKSFHGDYSTYHRVGCRQLCQRGGKHIWDSAMGHNILEEQLIMVLQGIGTQCIRITHNYMDVES